MLPSELTPEQKDRRMRFGLLARSDLIIFSVLNTPQPQDAFDPRLSRFQWQPHHYAIARALEDVAAGKINRLEIELPPRHGKSELSVRQFCVWWMAKYPTKSIIVVTHTDTLAKEHGRDCRDYWLGMGFALTFGLNSPSALRQDSQASDRLQTKAGGVVTFSGRGGLGAGIGADLMVFDDFFKNSQEAESASVRDEAWRTFIADCQSRLNNESCPIVMIGSRRHEDDVQGRLFDPTNPHYDTQEAARWTRIRIPALSEGEEVDPLKRPKDEALWPDKFSKEFYIAKRNHKSDIVRIDFQTQDQCSPRPQEGTWFKKSWLKTYSLAEKPQHLQIYVASDHAYRKGEKNDSTCMLVAGVDPTGAIYILPRTFWGKCETDVLVQEMFKIVKQTPAPSIWWAARDAISGSLKPFIERQMLDKSVFFPLDDSIRESKDIVSRSASIRGMMAMGLVKWPSDWPQWAEAESQLLSFPGKSDDLVAALAILGMGLAQMVKPEQEMRPKDYLAKPMTMAWVKQSNNIEKEREKVTKAVVGW